MAGWDKGDVFFSDQDLAISGRSQDQRFLAQGKFREFIRTFREDNDYVYRNALLQNYVVGDYYLRVALEDVQGYDSSLSDALLNSPSEYLPLFEEAAKEAAGALNSPDKDLEELHNVQIQLTSNGNPLSLRDLTSSHVSKLVQVPGIIISASKPQAKATRIQIICRSCSHTAFINLRPAYGGASLPRKCDRPKGEGDPQCPLDPYVIVPDKSKYVDQQSLKLQETPETVPTGELPRSILLSADRYLVSQVVPGTRVTIMGMYSVMQTAGKQSAGAVAIRSPYIRVVGIHVEEEGTGRQAPSFTKAEEEEFQRMARDKDIYKKLATSIAPSIYGSGEIKKALACQLFGGARKMLPDGMRLRGDINVLLLGDPSTGKSQMLKFVEKVAPICVYTSGKGSSAAGLTASVVREKGTGEFHLEGGAMVLADGGVVCIDEFDKMRIEDRVAIHEAMEQQTISIAKAGITTILNSRCSVLAAANPTFGRYDDLKSSTENIEFETSILSRFDLIFIVRDVREEGRDQTIAHHVINLHMNQKVDHQEGEIDLPLMKRYVQYCRLKCSPRLTDDAATKLGNHYATIRQETRDRSIETDMPQAVPITVRQLEAIVRISESLAKMTLKPEVTVDHVDEAIRLFKVSTLDAVNSGMMVGESLPPDRQNEVQNAENQIKRRLAIGHTSSEKRIVEQLTNLSDWAVRKAIQVMTARGDLNVRNQGRMIVRKR